MSLNGARQCILLVLKFKLGSLLAQQGLLLRCTRLACIPDRNTHVHTGTQPQIVLELLAVRERTVRVVCIADTRINTNRRIVTTLCNVILQLRIGNTLLRTLYLRPCRQCTRIHLAGSRNHLQRLLVTGNLARYVKVGIDIQLQKAFQLTLVVVHLSLAVDDVILCILQLSLQLDHVSMRHLPLLLHLHATVVLGLGNFYQFLVNLYSLPCIHYLHIQLHNLLLYCQLARLRSQLVNLVLQFLLFHRLVVDTTVPYRPVHVNTIRAVVRHLVVCNYNLTAFTARSTTLHWTVSHVVRGTETNRRPQCRLVLFQCCHSRFLGNTVFPDRDIVLHSILYALVQCPSLGIGHHARNQCNTT